MLADHNDHTPLLKNPANKALSELSADLTQSLPADEDRVLRLIDAAGGSLPSDDEGDVPSLRRTVKLKMSVENMYCCICCLRDKGYVETTVIAQTTQWLRHYRPLRVTLTDKAHAYLETVPPVSSGWTRILVLLIACTALIAGLAWFLFEEPNYPVLALCLVISILITLLARRAGKPITGLS